jgi:dUTP pyrophosphatase
MIPINIKFLSKMGKLPTRANETDAGYDLYSAEYGSIPPLSRLLIKTDISVAIPQGYYGRIAPRSGLAHKHGIDVLAGVIDASYRGNIGVILYNTSKDTGFEFTDGARIAQLIIEKCHSVDWTLISDLDITSRGDGGYGSTGQ